ncbi:MAG: hypothetical protein QOJ13_2971 [Gaiellales bacterium]|jgi:hypothetical protein|nr:hypothetical protein [Gaiellales bacterium]
MSHDFRIDDRQKAFGDLTAADLEQIRDHPDRGFPIESYR